MNGNQMLHFYNADGSEADPAALLDSLTTQLVAALSGPIPLPLRAAVNLILANPLQYVQNNALLTISLTAGGSLPFVPCFTAGTMIMTRAGEIAVEDLCIGDEVLTVDNGFRPIRWIGTRRLSAHQLQMAPQLRPIRIEIGALGNGLPLRPLEVSPQHRCLIRSHIAQRMVGEREVLAAAKHLLAAEGISVVESDAPVTYFHLLLDSHELLISNGAATESFFIGPVAMASMSADDRFEIMTLFPDLSTQEAHYVMSPARKFLVGHIAKSIVARAIKNTIPVVEYRHYISA
ncbi:Hint domain-containing protein [Cypionkella sp. TWP1-2-1b2]|uniref:Hint domain-containing protein n=1 Tax=Cypionkella sp. TWP1-2-1b2 TaxID=2804675 RepID=UPI003CF941F8